MWAFLSHALSESALWWAVCTFFFWFLCCFWLYLALLKIMHSGILLCTCRQSTSNLIFPPVSRDEWSFCVGWCVSISQFCCVCLVCVSACIDFVLCLSLLTSSQVWLLWVYGAGGYCRFCKSRFDVWQEMWHVEPWSYSVSSSIGISARGVLFLVFFLSSDILIFLFSFIFLLAFTALKALWGG